MTDRSVRLKPDPGPPKGGHYIALALVACICAAVAAWVSLGTVALAPAASNERVIRLGLLPPLWVLAASTIFFLGFFWWLVRRDQLTRALPLLATVFLLLPWLPKIRTVFLIWNGPIETLIWWLVIVGVMFSSDSTSKRTGPAVFFDPRRAPYLAAIVSLILYSGAAIRFAPYLPGGDEPHYLIIAQSLWQDGDLRIQNNHRRGDHWNYFEGVLRPDYLRRGIDGQIYSVHAPGLGAVVAPAVALAGYPGAVALMIVLASIGSAVTWRVAYHVSKEPGAAWLGWLAVTLSAPFLFQAFSIFPDGLAATLMIVAVSWLVEMPKERSSWRWMGRGALIGLLPWLNTRLALLTVLIAVFVLIRQIVPRHGWRPPLAFIGIIGASLLAWLAYFWLIYGTVDPRAPYGTYTQSGWRNVPEGLVGLLFDQRFGMLAYAPVLLGALAGFFYLGRERPGLTIELLLLGGLYLFEVSFFRIWWGGSSGPARLAVPVILLLAAPVAMLFARTGLATRRMLIAALAVGLWLTTYLCVTGDPDLVFGGRIDRPFLWDSISPIFSLSATWPSLFRDAPRVAVQWAALWVALLALVWGCVTLMHRAIRLRGASFALTLLSAGAAVMIGLEVGWRIRGTIPVTADAGQLDLWRRYDPKWLSQGLVYDPFRSAEPPDVLHFTRIVFQLPPALVNEQARVSLMRVPPGEYLLTFQLSTDGPNADRSFSDAVSLKSGGHGQSIEKVQLVRSGRALLGHSLQLPVDIRSLHVGVNSDFRSVTDVLVWTPRRIVAHGDRLGCVAVNSARFGLTKVYFCDRNAFVEPTGFWVGGGRETSIVVQPADTRRTIRMFVRNGATANQVEVETGRGTSAWSLAPHEEREAVIPIHLLEPAGTGATIRLKARTGFRPALVERGSEDPRFLGCWVEVRN